MSRNEVSFSSYWQADQQLLQASCDIWSIRVLTVSDWACHCADHRHFSLLVDHDWPSRAFFPSLAVCVYLLPTVWFPWAVWKLSPSFYYRLSEQHLTSCGHLPAGAAGTDLCWAGVFIALSCNSWTPVCCKTFKDLWKMGLLISLHGKMPLVSDYSKTNFSFWWEMMKQNLGVCCRVCFPAGIFFCS